MLQHHGPASPLPQLSRYRSHESLIRGQLCGYESHSQTSRNNAPAPHSSRTSASVTSQTSTNNHGAPWLAEKGRANSWSSGLGQEREFEEFSRQNPRRERRRGHRDSSSSSSSSKQGTNSTYQMQNPAALGFLLGTALVFNRNRQEKEKEPKQKEEKPKKEQIIRKDDDVLKIICQGITLEPEKGKLGAGADGGRERKVDAELNVKQEEGSSKVRRGEENEIAQEKPEDGNDESPRVQIATKDEGGREGLPLGANSSDLDKAEKATDEVSEDQKHTTAAKEEDHNIPFQITSMDFAHSGSNSVRSQQKFLHPKLIL